MNLEFACASSNPYLASKQCAIGICFQENLQEKSRLFLNILSFAKHRERNSGFSPPRLERFSAGFAFCGVADDARGVCFDADRLIVIVAGVFAGAADIAACDELLRPHFPRLDALVSALTGRLG